MLRAVARSSETGIDDDYLFFNAAMAFSSLS